MAQFTPTQPVRDASGELTQLVERILSSSNNPVTSVEKLLSERYGGRGPFTAELGIALSFCLREPTVTRVCEKLRQNQAVLGLLAMDRATMVVEEVFRNACYGYQRAGILLTQLIRLGVVSLKDYVKFLKVTVTNPSIFYYWTILDSLLAASSDATDYVDLVACLLFIYDGCLRTQNNSYSLSILDQLLHHYLDDFRKMDAFEETKEMMRKELSEMKFASEKTAALRNHIVKDML